MITFNYEDVNSRPGDESFGTLVSVESKVPNSNTVFGVIPSSPWPDNPIIDFQPNGLFIDNVFEQVPSGGGSSSGTGSAAPGPSSSKSTAIVPCSWNEEGFTALFIAEMPEVRFDDHAEIFPKKRVSKTPIDPKFMEVCEPDSVRVISALGDTAPVRYARIEEGSIVLGLSMWKRPTKVCVRLSGIRRGFRNLRFPDRTKNQFEHNERFINSAYPDK